MTHAIQKTFRFLFPGLAVFTGISALLSGKTPSDFFAGFEFSAKTVGAPLLTALLVGEVYWATGLSERLWRWTFRRTASRIVQRLCQSAEARGVIVIDPTSRSFTHCIEDEWYRLIDADDQLTKKSESIRINGTVATSSLEVLIVAVALAALFAILRLTAYLSWVAVCMSLALVSLGVLLLSRARHVSLVDQQIDIAERHFGVEISQRVEACARV
jgi:hypothetical protein